MISRYFSFRSWNFYEMKMRLITLLAILLAGQSLFAQDAIGTWKDYLNYSNANDLDILGDKIYVSAGNTMFILNKSDNSLSRLNRVNGLSDVGISTIRANEGHNLIIVGYINGNIDVIQNNQITNITDIKNSSVAGDKTIRHILFYENSALISTGIGIINFNLDRLEIKDTYKIISNGDLSINETTVLNDTLYAATEEGLYFGSLNSDLTIFPNWMQDLSIPEPFDPVKNISNYSGKLYINQPNANPSGLYFYAEGAWSNIFNSPEISDLRSTALGVNISAGSYGDVRVENNPPVLSIGSYGENSPKISSFLALDNGETWIADAGKGLVERSSDGVFEFIHPDGPATNRAFDIDFKHGQLWVASGAPKAPGTWNNNFVFDGFYALVDGAWINFTRQIYTEIGDYVFADIAKVYVSPSNPNKAYVGSYFKGMLETNGDMIEAFYDYTNSTLQQWEEFTDTDWTGVAGFAEDNDKNIWISNSRVAEPLSVKTPDGNWKSFDCKYNENGSQVGLGNNTQLLDLVIDQQDQKWAVVNRGGIIVFSEGNSISDSSDDKARLLEVGSGNGGLPSNEVICLAEDLDGEMWVGTTEGIAVFYSPFDALTTSFSDARQILVEQDGVYQYLLDGQSVSAIAIDGANRKWISTYGSGVFLMSDDGTEQVQRFNTENSPLLSDVVNDIVIDQSTGEVFFATDEGIVSYVSDATGGNTGTVDCSSVYPNPVRETYSGPISITGLTRDTEVKITDVRGNLVYSTISNGSKAIWDGKNANGQRVATGVYFALSSSPDGSSKCTTKILVIK